MGGFGELKCARNERNVRLWQVMAQVSSELGDLRHTHSAKSKNLLLAGIVTHESLLIWQLSQSIHGGNYNEGAARAVRWQARFVATVRAAAE